METELLSDKGPDFVSTNLGLAMGDYARNWLISCEIVSSICQPAVNPLTHMAYLAVNYLTVLKKNAGPCTLDTATCQSFAM